MEDRSLDNVLDIFERFISDSRLKISHRDLVLRRCLNEAWFSNSLAWLLDPEGSHGYGSDFAAEFIKLIGKIRSGGGSIYAHKNSLLKRGLFRIGVKSTGFDLSNAAVIREFYLAGSIKKRSGTGTRFCDVVLLDLDSSDGIFIAIENKLFASNRPGQLKEYYETIEERYGPAARIREYVYLTLRGTKPKPYEAEGTSHRYWVRMSWLNHVLPILEGLADKNEHIEVKNLRMVLSWLQAYVQEDVHEELLSLKDMVVDAASECLLDELQLLGKGGKGHWKSGKRLVSGATLVHSSRPKFPLHISLLPNLTITVQGRRSGQAQFEKIIVPYGANTDQVHNLLKISAKYVYRHHFQTPELYMGEEVDVQTRGRKLKRDHRNLFDFLHKYQHQLRVLFSIAGVAGSEEEVQKARFWAQ